MKRGEFKGQGPDAVINIRMAHPNTSAPFP